MAQTSDAIALIANKYESELLAEWQDSFFSLLIRRDATTERELQRLATTFLGALKNVTVGQNVSNVDGNEWRDIRAALTDLSELGVRQGFSPIDTANFVFSLKQPLFSKLRIEFASDFSGLADATWATSNLLDKFGLFTIEVYQRSREQVILRQQQELLELSTPVVQLWKNVLALPLIGTLDSNRTQVVMESLLEKIVETGASIAIIDITGVPTVDTLVAQHLLKTVAAARLMGADCIISGIRPQIAQTIVHLGVNLEDVVTKATLADAFIIALERTGSSIHYGEKAGY